MGDEMDARQSGPYLRQQQPSVKLFSARHYLISDLFLQYQRQMSRLCLPFTFKYLKTHLLHESTSGQYPLKAPRLFPLL
jgi:hypothetical protein